MLSQIKTLENVLSAEVSAFSKILHTLNVDNSQNTPVCISIYYIQDSRFREIDTPEFDPVT